MDIHQSASTSFTLPEEIQQYKDVARRIVRDELMPLEQEYLASKNTAYGLMAIDNLKSAFGQERAQRLIDISRESGLWYILVDEAHGGLGLPLLAKVAIEEEFEYCAVPFPFANVPNILYECKGDQIDRYLTPIIEGQKTYCFAQAEPNAGSDPGGMMQTKAWKEGDEWVISGIKMWISNAHESDVVMVQAVTDPDKRQRGGITMFVMDRHTPGIEIHEGGLPTWIDNGRHAQYLVNFNNVRVTEENILGEVGKGFNLGQKWLTIHDRLLRGPYALGKMQRALDMSIDWAKQRTTFGQLIAERQAIQWKLVDMNVDIQALRAMTYSIAARADAGEDVRNEAALVKLVSGDWGARTLDNAIQIHGAMGEALELPLTKFYRLLRHAQIGGGTSEIQRMLIARSLLK